MLTLAVCLAVTGCFNRAAARIPGASLPFPAVTTGFRAEHPIGDQLTVATPVDARAAHYGEAIAGTDWHACRTDPFYTHSVAEVVGAALVRELESSHLFNAVSTGPAAAGGMTLRTEVDAFCADVRGFMVVRVAAVTSLRLTLERGGEPSWQTTIQRVVTDDDPEYSGARVSTIEQAMQRALADSLRLALRDLLEQLEGAHLAAAAQSRVPRRGAFTS